MNNSLFYEEKQEVQQVHAIEDFATSLGRIVIVKNDRIFHVGQKIEIDGKIYLITGIHFAHNPNSSVGLRVSPVAG